MKTVPGADRKIGQTHGRLTRITMVQAAGFCALFVALYLLVAVLGGLERLPGEMQATAALAFFAGALVLAFRAWRRYRAPSLQTALAALDAQSDLRPLSTLSDRPAQPAGEGRALWDAHQSRLGGAIRDLRVPNFAAEWRSVDPYYLRFAMPAALGAAMVVTSASVPDRLHQAFSPDFGVLVGADNLRVEAWITPPAYSGRAPVFLAADLDRVRVPTGSELTLRAFGRSAPSLRIAGDANTDERRFDAMPDGAFEAKAIITADSEVSVRWWGERAAWTVLASPDAAPEARFVETPTLTTRDRTVFTWAASDDYGVSALFLALRLKSPHPDALEAEDLVPVPLPGTGEREVGEETELDLTRHRWAGLPIIAEIVAIDGAKQEGRSEPIEFTLPEKLFLQPLAKAAQEVRVTVLREPANYAGVSINLEAVRPGAINTGATGRLEAAPLGVRQAAVMLDALTYEPARYFEDPGLYLGLRAARGVLTSASEKSAADRVDPLLWAVAMKAEYGSAADALRALMAARKALEQALRNGAPEDQIRRLMEAFRDAANNYVAAKMAEAMANGTQDAPLTEDGMAGGEGGGLGSNDFEDMLNALQDLAETGAADQARQLLSDITNMLENLEFQQGGSGGEGGWPGMPGQSADGENDAETPPQEQELTGALERLSELLREQRELNDDTLEAERGQSDSSEFGQNPSGGQPGEEGQAGGGGLSGLADRQDDLGALADRFAEAIENGEVGRAGDTEVGDGQGASAGEEDGENGRAGGSEGEGGEAFAQFDGLGEDAEAALDAIARAQRRAADALERGDIARARRLQDNATRSLRDLSGELAGALDQLAEARDGGDGSDEADTDPFGRPVGGVNDGQNVSIPEQAERQRAKDILEELRRRFERAEDEDEKQYLERLLDRF
ncbi:MAG: DUF4175 family protein [Pseudomonadota bacterium]